MKKLIAICVAALITSMLATTTGAAMLYMRHQAGPPQHYRDAAITEIDWSLPGTVNINVVKGNNDIVMQRVAEYVRATGGKVNQKRKSHMKVHANLAARRHISTLHADGKQLSPNYRNWDHQASAPRGETLSKFYVDVEEKTFSKLQLDLGISLIVAGGILSCFSGILTAASIADYLAAKRA